MSSSYAERTDVATQEEKQAYIDEMVQKRGYILDYHKALVQQDFEVMKKANELVDATYLKERSLDRKTKELIFVVSLVVMRAPKAHIQSHIRAALDHGATEEEVLEAIEISLPEAGVVVFQEGFEAWREAVDAEVIEPSFDVQ